MRSCDRGAVRSGAAPHSTCRIPTCERSPVVPFSIRYVIHIAIDVNRLRPSRVARPRNRRTPRNFPIESKAGKRGSISCPVGPLSAVAPARPADEDICSFCTEFHPTVLLLLQPQQQMHILGGRCRRRWHYWFNHRRQCAFVVVSGITSGSFRHYDVLLPLPVLLQC